MEVKIMANKDMEINGKKMLESMESAQEYLEKALECDNEKLRKKIEILTEGMDKFQQNYKKRAYRKIAKKSGMPIEMIIAMILPISIMFREALDFDDNELREFIELYIENEKISKDFFFGAEK